MIPTMGAKYLVFTSATGYEFNLNFLILFLIISPFMIWLCIQINKKLWTPVIHSTAFIAISWILIGLINVTGFISWWWSIPISFLLALLREVYSYVRYNDFGWDDLGWGLIGICMTTSFYWLVH